MSVQEALKGCKFWSPRTDLPVSQWIFLGSGAIAVQLGETTDTLDGGVSVAAVTLAALFSFFFLSVISKDERKPVSPLVRLTEDASSLKPRKGSKQKGTVSQVECAGASCRGMAAGFITKVG